VDPEARLQCKCVREAGRGSAASAEITDTPCRYMEVGNFEVSCTRTTSSKMFLPLFARNVCAMRDGRIHESGGSDLRQTAQSSGRKASVARP
jgi:hypothetical protein